MPRMLLLGSGVSTHVCPWKVVCLQLAITDQPDVVGESVYTVADRSKRRKTADKKAAAAKAVEEAAAIDPSEPWAIHHRQPWADKEVKPAELNDEQKAFLEQASMRLKARAVYWSVHTCTCCSVECCLASSYDFE